MPRVDQPATTRAASFSSGRLITVGLIGGLLSGLLGVGGGSVIVPLLVLWLWWEEHRATATSLASLVFAVSAGSIAYGLHGEIDVNKAMLVGLPAVAGVLLGARIAARLPGDTLLFLFVAVQLIVAAVMLIG